MARLNEMFRKLKRDGGKALSIYVTAGYPKRDSTPELVMAVERAGADFVEIGLPFSDPIADGPTIQKASQAALQNGMTLSHALAQVAEIRQATEIPLILMSYFNPILRYGLKRFAEACQEVGVDGLIVPDLIPEEYASVVSSCDPFSMRMNFLVAPNTSLARVRQIDEWTADFLYCVSVTGVTGARQGISESLLEYLRSVRKVARRPCMVGFGVARAEDARKLAQHCDGVIVGSALINLIEKHANEPGLMAEIETFVTELKTALQGVKNGH